MRCWTAILLFAALAAPAVAAPRTPLGSARKPPTLQQQRRWLGPAMRAAGHKRWEQAYWLAARVAKAHPHAGLVQAMRAALGQRAVAMHLMSAQRDQDAGERLAAGIEYRAALTIQPKNPTARRAFAQLFGLPATAESVTMRVRRAAAPVQLALPPGWRNFDLRGGLRHVVGEVAAAYGLRAYVQNAVPDTPVRLRLGEATFAQATQVLRAVGHVTWTALDAHTVYFGLASQARRFQPLEVRTFYLPWVRKPTQLAELEQTLRGILDPYEVQGNLAAQSITVRARPAVVDAAERLLLNLSGTRGGVLFEVQIAEVSRSVAESLGLTAPYQLQALALGPILSQFSSASQSESQLLQDLFQSGGLNGLLNSGQISAQLSALESQLA
ncbi:MAG: hypothetical protein ACRD2E_13120, partial [Terriglobales bacterium]